MKWYDEYVAQRKEVPFNRPLKVFYGYAKLTPKIVRKRSLVVIYENGHGWNDRKEKSLKQKMHIVYIRNQTPEESNDAYYSTREFTRYEMFIDDKRWKGNIEAVLENNFLLDENHVSAEERETIRCKMREGFYKKYNVSRKLVGQQQIIFY